MWGTALPAASSVEQLGLVAGSASGAWVAKVEELEAQDLDALEQHQVERDAGDLARGVADGDEAAA